MFIIKDPDNNKLSCMEIAKWANSVHHATKGKGNPYQWYDYVDNNTCRSLVRRNNRLSGDCCDCGADKDNNSNGTFVLFPLTSSEVKNGGKAYIYCEKCGCISHL